MKLNAYLSYPGTCEEALNFYRSVLGGEIGEKNLYDGSPMESPESKGKILHTDYTFGDGNTIMAADSIGYPVAKESNITLALGFDDVAETERVFNGLSDGGTVTMPLQDTFWGAKFGMFTDKFGINWMVNCELQGN